MRIYPVLLLLLLIAAMAAAMVVPTVAQTTTPQPIITIVVTTPNAATPIATQSNGCYAPLPLTVGTSVTLRGGVNVRSAPSTSAPLMNYYPSPVVLNLDAGPVCANGFNWWQISGDGEPGWVIEGKPLQYYLDEAPPSTEEVCSPALDTISVGGKLRTISGSKVRQDPFNDGFVVTVVQPNVQLDVIGGPRCEDQINWWQVRAPFGTTSTLVTGWIAEGFPGQYFVAGLTASGQPVIACRAPLRLHNGTRAAVTYTDGVPRRLRATPSSSGGVVASLLDGVEFQVINDNVTCADGYNWWQVQIVATGQTGWLAEGRPGNYWFQVLIN